MGPGGITQGSYDATKLSQDQRQWLWENFGHSGQAPVGYGGEGSSGGSGGTKALTAPDVAALRDQVYKTLQPYYTQLAKESQGDFNRAVQSLQEDYVKGTRDAKINYAFTQNQQSEELKNTLSTLGITNTQDQDALIDNLNKRGMAVYQNNPDSTPNAVQRSAITSNTDTNIPVGTPINDTSTIMNPQDAQMGRGGYELAQLQEQQRLRQEAQQRAATKPIEDAGIKLKQYTNLPAGVDPNLPPDQLAKALSASGVDRSQLGTAEQGLVRGEEQQTRDLQKTQEDLANQRSGEVGNIAGGLAATGTKSLGSEMENELLQEQKNTFVNSGT